MQPCHPFQFFQNKFFKVHELKVLEAKSKSKMLKNKYDYATVKQLGSQDRTGTATAEI